MKDLKITKGEWTYNNERNDRISVCSDESGAFNIATVYTEDFEEGVGEANAKVIIASKDLLNACIMMIDEWHSKTSNMSKEEPVYLKIARQAIKKATE